MTLPLRQSRAGALVFLKENGDWVSETLRRQPARVSLWDYLNRKPRLSLMGESYPVTFSFGPRIRATVTCERKRGVALGLAADQALEDQLRQLLRGLAREYLPRRTQDLARRSGKRVHGVSVRDQRSRWGSCSETSGISLNWRLILLPPVLQDHVILHEIAHLFHFDHSPAFHATLARLDPQAPNRAKQLEKLTPGLIHLGRKVA